MAVLAVTDLLAKLKIDHAFVGDVALSAWLGEKVEKAPIDVLAVLSSEQKNQVAMMASNRGFSVDREELLATEELDLIPLGFPSEGRMVRIHVLVASNALYAKMVRVAVEAQLGERTLSVLSAEDLGLLLSLSDDDSAATRLLQLRAGAGAEFDLDRYNSRLISIGLAGKTIKR